MLLRIAVENFRSIKDRAEINLEATGLKGLEDNIIENKQKKVLKTAAIYGPNASGKSNLILSVQALTYLIHLSADNKPEEDIIPYDPFILDSKIKQKPIFLEIEFIAKDNIRYIYSISYCKKKIHEEKFYYFPNNVKSVLYERIDGQSIKFGDSFKGPKKTIEKQLLKNQLFFSKAALNNVESVQAAYKYFAKDFVVLTSFASYRGEIDLGNVYARIIAEGKNPSFAKRFNKLICALDTGITKVVAEKTDWENTSFPESVPEEQINKLKENYQYDIKTYHKVFNDKDKEKTIVFDLEQESTGTRSLMTLGGLIVDAMGDGSVIIIDEFEKNLHPMVTKYLIQLFHNPIVNKKNAQLIFATHDVTQLDNEVFRRDQVWFTEKNELGGTEVFRCSEIEGLRLGTPLDKWYTSGRLGATPLINDMDFLIEMQNEDEEN